MNGRSLIVRLLLPLLAALSISTEVTAAPSPGCNDANLLGSALVSDICWSCMLPIKLLGVGGGGEDPAGSANKSLCVCFDPLGVPSPGIGLGVWLPYRLFEMVRNPYCMASLGGFYLMNDPTNLRGPGGDPATINNRNTYHSHVYSFPLATMMELVTSKHCNPGGYTDMDVIMMDEFDPVISDEELSPFIYFETAMFANPVALAACTLECGALTGGAKPISTFAWWCAGCWGGIYPMVNSNIPRGSPHTDTNLMAARQLAVKHRRGMGQRTYGNDAMCGGKLSIFLPKEQYKWSQIFPLAEASGRCCHWTGESDFKTGGQSRNIPAVGEDYVHMLWRYTDCCMN